MGAPPWSSKAFRTEYYVVCCNCSSCKNVGVTSTSLRTAVAMQQCGWYTLVACLSSITLTT
eukprot:9436-Heterococcus_DN1.PRE.5